MILKVKVTKEHLKLSMWCGTNKSTDIVRKSCAIALAVRDVFPCAAVELTEYFPFGNKLLKSRHNGSKFISVFDDLTYDPEKRPYLPEEEIELELTDEIIEEATKHLDFHSIVNQTPYLQLIEQ